jgi:hypothetical protein
MSTQKSLAISRVSLELKTNVSKISTEIIRSYKYLAATSIVLIYNIAAGNAKKGK